jgi:hypothetical protein
MRRVRSGCAARAASGHAVALTAQCYELASPHGSLSPGVTPDHIRDAMPHCASQQNGPLMSEMGHWRRFLPGPATSGLHRSTDIARPVRLVRLVPIAVIPVSADAAQAARAQLPNTR